VILPLVESLRPKQWTKNMLVFAGAIFSLRLGEPQILLRATAGFLAFSLLSGSVYLLNDVMDVAADRVHPRKSRRPIASGRLPIPAAWAALPVIWAGVAVLSLWLGIPFTITLVAYLVSNFAYTFWLKHQVILDVFLIANGFVLRAIAGVVLVRQVDPEVPMSPWLLVCTFFLALFLGASKRRRELLNAGPGAIEQRAVLRVYTSELLEVMMTVAGTCTLLSYALYTIWPATVAKFHTELLLATVPIVTYGIFRYLHLVRVSETSEDPSLVLLMDRPIQVTVVLYMVAVVWILYFAR
jgi:4-hydroxybenzoate polyprenyltransferase